MITFKELTYRNFLSCGDNPITINLNEHKSTLIVGSNGSGKSTILDALSFGLFGKPHRNVSKPLLVNAVNGKGCVVSVDFETSGQTFKIVRGIKPNLFEVWQNGEMIDQSASVRDYQKFLEQNILKLNHKSFHQIVVLGSSSFVPFMQLASHHRREVVEDLLDINIFSKMKGILKDRTTITKNKAKDVRSSLETLKGKHEYQQKYVDKMEDINREAAVSRDDEIAVNQSKISQLAKEGVLLAKEVSGLPSDINEKMTVYSDRISFLIKRAAELTATRKVHTTEVDFLKNNDNCPACTQDITPEFAESRVSTLSEYIEDSEGLSDAVSKETKLIQTSIAANTLVQDQIRDKTSKLSELQRAIEATQGVITKLSVKADVHDLTEAGAELKSLQIAADECRDLLDEHNDQLLYNEVAGEMLKDSGIRTKVIREYLPAMNTLINQHLQTLDFFVAFTLDENFEETIKSRHRDKFVYANFSEGEKMRIDLSLLFTWRQIAKMKNSTNTNLLILDETFDSSLDVDGVDNLMKILHTLGEETNTFIISHKPDMLESKLRSKIEFEKVNNFSRLT